MIATIAEKTAIAATMIVELDTIAGNWFPYDRYDRCDRWTFFLSDHSDHGEHSDHMETGLEKPCLLHKSTVFLVTERRRRQQRERLKKQ